MLCGLLDLVNSFFRPFLCSIVFFFIISMQNSIFISRLYYLHIESFSHQLLVIGIHCKSPQVSRTHHSILADLNSVIVSKYLSLFTLSFNFTLRLARTAKSTILQVILILLIIIRSGCLTEVRRSTCIIKSHRSLCVSFSRTDAGLSIYLLFVWSNFDFLHNSQWITLPTQSCLLLNSFCANLLH